MMTSQSISATRQNSTSWWRYAILVIVPLVILIALLIWGPISQDTDYHRFADTRTVLGIPNFWDVFSNLPFLIIGMWGVRFCLRNPLGPLHSAWTSFFAGVALISLGSAYYHLNPNNDTLVWDRLAMTIAFMSLLTGVFGDYVDQRFAAMLVPAILLGLSSVLYWSQVDDLRPYFWLQITTLLTIALIMILFRSVTSHKWLMGLALLLYILAVVTELTDRHIFEFTGRVVSGHTIKHLLAAAGSYGILLLLQKRKPAIVGPDEHQP